VVLQQSEVPSDITVDGRRFLRHGAVDGSYLLLNFIVAKTYSLVSQLSHLSDGVDSYLSHDRRFRRATVSYSIDTKSARSILSSSYLFSACPFSDLSHETHNRRFPVLCSCFVADPSDCRGEVRFFRSRSRNSQPAVSCTLFLLRDRPVRDSSPGGVLSLTFSSRPRSSQPAVSCTLFLLRSRTVGVRPLQPKWQICSFLLLLYGFWAPRLRPLTRLPWMRAGRSSACSAISSTQRAIDLDA